MAKGNGGTRSASMGSRQYSLIPSNETLLRLAQSGELAKMGNSERGRILAATQKESILSSGTNIYTEDEERAIDAYSKVAYEAINNELANPGSESPKVQKYARDIENAIRKRTLARDVIVFRGTVTGNGDSNKGLVSTSLNPSIASQFSEYGKGLSAYLIPRGTNFIYITKEGEDEVLLPKGFNLRKYKIK